MSLVEDLLLTSVTGKSYTTVDQLSELQGG